MTKILVILSCVILVGYINKTTPTEDDNNLQTELILKSNKEFEPEDSLKEDTKENISDSFNALYANCIELNLPIFDSTFNTIDTAYTLDSSYFKFLSLEKFGYKNDVFKLLGKINYSDSFKSIIISRGSRFVERYLINLDKDNSLIASFPFGGFCHAQCDCIRELFAYDFYIKEVNYAWCPDEITNEEILDGNRHVSKYRVAENGTILLVQRTKLNYYDYKGMKSSNNIIGHDRLVGISKQQQDIYQLKDTASRKVGQIALGEEIYYYQSTDIDWKLIETKDGIEGCILNKNINYAP